MTENEKENVLYIPVQVTAEQQIFTGFGKSQLIYTSIGLVIGCIMGIIAYLSCDEFMVFALFMFGIPAIVFVCVVKDGHNESFIDKLKYIYMYYKSQKKYVYQYLNIWEDNDGEK